MILLDTDLLSLLDFNDSPATLDIVARLEVAADVGDQVTLSIISFEEQARGWLSYINSRRRAADQVDAYKRLQRMLERFGRMIVLPFDASAAEEFEKLRIAARRVNAMDLKIAATAISHDALLLSSNARDFAGLPGLRFEHFRR